MTDSVAARDRQLGRSAAGRHQRQRGRGQDRDGGRGADAQRPRRAEQRVDRHRHERRVEADLHRQSGHRGVRHRLGHDDGRGGEPGDHVGSQPLARVVVQQGWDAHRLLQSFT